MATGQRIGIVSVVVLAVAIIGFYLWKSAGQTEDSSITIEPNTTLPQPSPPGTVNNSDPSMTKPGESTASTPNSTGAADLNLGVSTLLDQTAPAAPASATATGVSTTPATTQLKPLSAAELGALATNTSLGGATSVTPTSNTIGITRTPAATGTATSGGGGYVVRQGDSMWSIAQRTLGNGALWPQIARANPSVNPDSLQPGQRLTIPGMPASTTTATPTSAARAPATIASAAPTPASASNARIVVVQNGETLWAIAQREYGDGTLWQVIFEANQDRMRNPNDLRAGERIRVPSLSSR